MVLPDVGGGVFSLSYLENNTQLLAGQVFTFPTGGVAAFTVTGIRPEAGLDPANGTAFITGLTFAGPGRFTGTMTPITLDFTPVPAPAMFAPIAAGLLGLVIASRGSRQRQGRNDET